MEQRQQLMRRDSVDDAFVPTGHTYSSGHWARHDVNRLNQSVGWAKYSYREVE